jgi:predicted Zn-dependent peptidase
MPRRWAAAPRRACSRKRARGGLCYSIYAFSNGFQDSGFLGVYVGTGEAEAAGVSAVIAGEMEAMVGDLTEAEVARARAQLKVSLLMGMERPVQIMPMDASVSQIVDLACLAAYQTAGR